MEFLNKHNIQTRIHYPKPIHRQKAYLYSNSNKSDLHATEKFCSQILSLPMYPSLQKKDINRIISTIRFFFSK